jgi:hypothetical protein
MPLARISLRLGTQRFWSAPSRLGIADTALKTSFLIGELGIIRDVIAKRSDRFDLIGSGSLPTGRRSLRKVRVGGTSFSISIEKIGK